MNEKYIHLTSGEIASLWSDYLSNSMAKCMIGFMLKHIEDPEIKSIVQSTYDMTIDHLDEMQAIFKKDNFAVPNGFSEQEVNMEAPWLYTDLFCLSYVNHLASVGMVNYSGHTSMSTRKDIRDYFTKALQKVSDLYNQCIDISLQKGVNARHPYIQVPQELNYVESKKYMSGLNPFNEKRPLNALEISHLYTNIMTNSIGLKLCLSFAQTSPVKEIQEYITAGKGDFQKTY